MGIEELLEAEYIGPSLGGNFGEQQRFFQVSFFILGTIHLNSRDFKHKAGLPHFEKSLASFSEAVKEENPLLPSAISAPLR
jgi:hypothetical protein